MTTDDRKQRDGATEAERNPGTREQTEETSRRVVATVHAEASPASEGDDVRPIGNTDAPVTARDPDAP